MGNPVTESSELIDEGGYDPRGQRTSSSIRHLDSFLAISETVLAYHMRNESNLYALGLLSAQNVTNQAGNYED